MRCLASLLSLLIGACALPEDGNPTPRCALDVHCPVALRCYRSFCIDDEDADAGSATIGFDDDSDAHDAGTAPGTDAARPSDAGATRSPVVDAGSVPLDAGATHARAAPASPPAMPPPPKPGDLREHPKPGGPVLPTEPGGGPGRAPPEKR